MMQTMGTRRSVQIKALLSLGMLAGLGAVSTLAAWTGAATATAPISAATVSIGVGGTAANAGATYTVPINSANWYPGMSQAAIVVVKNSSSIELPYAITGTVVEAGAGALGGALTVTVRRGATIVGSSPNASCSGGTLLSSKGTGATTFAPPSNPAPTPTSLAPQGSETLCVQYTLPLNAANDLQGKSTTVNLTFINSVGS